MHLTKFIMTCKIGSRDRTRSTRHETRNCMLILWIFCILRMFACTFRPRESCDKIGRAHVNRTDARTRMAALPWKDTPKFIAGNCNYINVCMKTHKYMQWYTEYGRRGWPYIAIKWYAGTVVRPISTTIIYIHFRTVAQQPKHASTIKKKKRISISHKTVSCPRSSRNFKNKNERAFDFSLRFVSQ